MVQQVLRAVLLVQHRGILMLAAFLCLAGRLQAASEPPAATPPVPATGQDASVTQLPGVTVIGATPLLGSGIDRDKVPAASTILDAQQISRNGPADALGALQEQVGAINLNSASGNPQQPTLLYHGFAAGALQGTEQGLAVYLNGVRFNQAFGDTVDWDLIPDIAINRVNVEGSNPAFGLNALGGAINVQLKDGFVYHGGEATLYGGSFGQIGGQIQVPASSRAMWPPTSPPADCARTAGVICNLPTCRTCTAMSAGAATGPSCMSI